MPSLHFLRRGQMLAGLVMAAASLASASALAGECPADKIGKNVTPAGATAPVGVTDTVLASIDLAEETFAAEGRNFRLRRLVIEPGGVVPWHSHEDRPALIYVVEGEIVEYASTCAVPILHKAGEVAPETHATAHWWQNMTDRTVVLLSADIQHDASDNNM
jgi:quercetin dioxygenase-like cupin family protein